MGTFIEDRRMAAGYRSQTALADAMGKGSSWVSRLERGAAKELPPPEDVALLSKFLGVSPAEIIAAAGYDIETGHEGDSPEVAALRPTLEAANLNSNQIRMLVRHVKSTIDMLKGNF